MKKVIHVVSGMVLCLTASYVASSSPAVAGYLYSTGNVDGVDSADTISPANAVSDQFTITAGGTVGAIQFAAWVISEDTFTNVDWAISTTPFGFDVDGSGNPVPVSISEQYTFAVDSNNIVASGTGASLTETGFFAGNPYGYDVDTEQISGLYIPLAAGTYWLTLENAVTFSPPNSPNSGDFVAWDQNQNIYDSPLTIDTAVFSGTPGQYGTFASSSGYSDTFQILGAPEPGTVTLLLSGFLLLAGSATYRTRRKASTSSLS